MAKIKQSDVSEQDVYGLITASAEKLEKQVLDLNKAIIKETKAVKRLGVELDKLSQKGIDNLIKKKDRLEKLTERSVKNDKAKVTATKAKTLTLKEYNAHLNKGQAALNRKVKASIADRKATIAQADSSKRLNKQVLTARNRLKRLTLELGKNNVKTKRATRNYDRLTKLQSEALGV